ncbi:MAG: acyl-CoA dehydrogenase family protein, partial [Deltaproteobacteria bacterium]|nr:acyl-CoA dehydrogenase family protein [Deltaproteobacteria bacterium]
MIESLLNTENKMFRDKVRRFAIREIEPHVKTWEKEGEYPDSYYKKI